jgi:hypothetical protein
LIRDAISAERYTDGLETTANFSANTWSSVVVLFFFFFNSASFAIFF